MSRRQTGVHHHTGIVGQSSVFRIQQQPGNIPTITLRNCFVRGDRGLLPTSCISTFKDLVCYLYLLGLSVTHLLYSYISVLGM